MLGSGLAFLAWGPSRGLRRRHGFRRVARTRQGPGRATTPKALPPIRFLSTDFVQVLFEPHLIFATQKNILSQQLSVETLNQPSQQVRRELALRERFRGFSCPGRSIGPPKNPGILPSSGGSDGRSERITLKLADGVGFEPSVRPGPHGHPDQTIGYGAPSASQMAYTSTRPGKAARASFLTRKSDPKDNFLILYNRLVSFRPL
jgi:hypothetical protein